MRGSLILRLVDVMLLLLLSLMAAASVEPANTGLPVTFELEDKGQLPEPLNLALDADGSLLLEGERPVTLDEFSDILSARTGQLLLYANAETNASTIIEVNRIARAANWRTAFVVQRRERVQ